MKHVHRFVAFVFAIVVASVSAAQDAPKPAFGVVKAYSLANVSAEEVVKTLEALYGTENPKLRFSADPRTNTVFAAAANPDDLEEVRSLLFELDTAATAPQRQMTILPLKNRTAEDAAQLVQNLMTGHNNVGKLSIVPDMNANTLIVMGGEEAVKLIQELLRAIDVPASETRVFMLQNAHANDAVAVLSELFGDDSRFAVDPRTNSVIISAQPETLTVIEALLMRMDEENIVKTVTHTRRVRVIWFVSGLEDPPPAPLPGDLQGVAAELTKLGMQDVHMVSQVVVNTNGKFSTNAAAMLDSPCQLEIGGELRSVDTDVGQNSLEIEIFANKSDGDPRDGEANLSRVSTELTTPLGHFVVLGVSPIGSLQSAFVVQVTESLPVDPVAPVSANRSGCAGP